MLESGARPALDFAAIITENPAVDRRDFFSSEKEILRFLQQLTVGTQLVRRSDNARSVFGAHRSEAEVNLLVEMLE